MPLAKLAEGTRGWDLLIAVLGENPITGDAVPRTAETLIARFPEADRSGRSLGKHEEGQRDRACVGMVPGGDDRARWVS